MEPRDLVILGLRLDDNIENLLTLMGPKFSWTPNFGPPAPLNPSLVIEAMTDDITINFNFNLSLTINLRNTLHFFFFRIQPLAVSVSRETWRDARFFVICFVNHLNINYNKLFGK